MSSFHPDLMRELRALLSEKEMTKFGGMWGKRIKTSPRAVAYAIEDLKLRKDNYHHGIKNRGAWLSNRYTAIKNLFELGKK